ncbi:MAG: 3-dehydroquinate synthase, partial [Cyanobacteria bacterium J083]
SYNIEIASKSLSQLGLSLAKLDLGKKVLLVSNPEIFQLYGEKVVSSLINNGFSVAKHLIPAGENYKNLTAIEQVYDTAFANYLERNSTAIALGGGVIGDMTGFVAATWLRGINFVQVPTSLLAMVDASIGGKTGVNHPQGKNLIGAFYQPKLVFIDPTVLQTLPSREFRAGMAEVIKYGVIWDENLFRELENVDDLDNINEDLLLSIIHRSCQAKAEVVSKDETEGGLRAILNYGHTIGHSVESLTDYRVFVHGEAVAIGMVAAGRIAVKMGLWQESEAKRQEDLIKKAGLPTNIPVQISAQDVIESLKNDKKVKAGKIRFILPTTIGNVVISDRVTNEVIREVVQELQA